MDFQRRVLQLRFAAGKSEVRNGSWPADETATLPKVSSIVVKGVV